MSAAFDAVVAFWSAWMAPVSAHTVLLVVLVLVLDRALLRFSWPALRTALWLLVVLRLILPPWVGSPVALTSAIPVAAVFRTDALGPAGSELVHGATAPQRAFFLAWLAGVVIAAAVEVARRARFRRALEREEALNVPPSIVIAVERAARAVGLRRAPKIRLSRLVRGPAAFGVFRPVVLLPQGCLAALGQRELEHVLLHECAHVRRGDLLWSALVRTLQVVYWFHPGVWLARTRLDELRELGCDAAVAAVLRERTGEYRRTLLMAARRGLSTSRRAELGGIGFLLGPANLILRLQALENATWRRPHLRRAAAVAIFALLAPTVVPLSYATTRASAEQDGSRLTPIDAVRDRALDELARDTLLEAARRGGRPGCLRLQLAALQLAGRPGTEPAR